MLKTSMVVLDENIYVIRVDNDGLWIEVLHTVTGRWEALPSLVQSKNKALFKMHKIDVVGIRIHVLLG